jgi:hypothetical protein
MTKEELIALGSSKVRNDSALLSLYFDMFKEEFGYIPPPPCCGNMSDWYKFEKSKGENISLTKNYEIMNADFEIKDKQKIYTYTDVKGIKRRCGGFYMTVEFAIAYLTNGTEEEVELRKKEFKTLPNLEQTEEQETEEQETEEQETEEQESEEQENEKEPSISQLKALYPQFAGAKDKKTLLKKIAEYESKKDVDTK